MINLKQKKIVNNNTQIFCQNLNFFEKFLTRKDT